jgi:hypothetical protein
MAVKNEQSVTTNCRLGSVLDEALHPSYTNFLGSLSILGYSYPLVFGIVVIPALVVVLPLGNEERGDQPAISTNNSNQSNPLTVTRLASDWIESKL